jgi:hypothetical protein
VGSCSSATLTRGEIPKGRARAHQDTATQAQSESDLGGPVLEPGVTVKRHPQSIEN